MKHIVAISVLLNSKLCCFEIDPGIDLIDGGNIPLKSIVLNNFGGTTGGVRPQLVGSSLCITFQAGIIQ